MTAPRVPMAITAGDSAGVGPEIVLRSLAAGTLTADPERPVVCFGDHAVLVAGADLLGVEVGLERLERVDASRLPGPGVLGVVDIGMLDAAALRPGERSARSGGAAREYVRRATVDALAGRVAGVVTMPINKEATQLAHPDFVGHTEFIAELCDARSVSMMLVGGGVAVTHVSTHVSLRTAIERVRPERVLDVIRLTDDTLRRFVERPRIAVCGLNPHAGEHGLFGDEDEMHIAPAIDAARGEGRDVSGPHPADTVFHQAVHRKRFDGIVCMYHDQGHAPMKLLAFESGVNVSIGLPIVRTSVDHGTAFDIAWRGEAFTASLDHALEMAWRLAGR